MAEGNSSSPNEEDKQKKRKEAATAQQNAIKMCETDGSRCIKYIEDAIRAAQEAYGPVHITVAFLKSLLSTFLEVNDISVEAENQYKQALAIAQQLRAEHNTVKPLAMVLVMRGEAMLQHGRLEEAKYYFEEALQLSETEASVRELFRDDLEYLKRKMPQAEAQGQSRSANK